MVFAATYFLVAVQRVRWLHLNRPAAALLGAVAMVTVQRAGVPVTVLTMGWGLACLALVR